MPVRLMDQLGWLGPVTVIEVVHDELRELVKLVEFLHCVLKKPVGRTFSFEVPIAGFPKEIFLREPELATGLVEHMLNSSRPSGCVHLTCLHCMNAPTANTIKEYRKKSFKNPYFLQTVYYLKR